MKSFAARSASFTRVASAASLPATAVVSVPVSTAIKFTCACSTAVEVMMPLRPAPLPVGDSLPLNVSQSAPIRKPFTPDAAACPFA